MAVSQTESNSSSVSPEPSDDHVSPGAHGRGAAAAKSPAKLDREARLAVALRENLRRRKAQQRARATSADGPEAG